MNETFKHALWYVFLLVFVCPAFYVASMTGPLTIIERVSYSEGVLNEFSETLAPILCWPIGLLSSIMPSDTFYIIVTTVAFFGGMWPWLLAAFICTTYPPHFMLREIRE